MARILIVDDEEDILTVVTVTLESAGHDVLTTTDPLQVPVLLNDEAPARLRLTLAVLVELDAVRPVPRSLASRAGG